MFNRPIESRSSVVYAPGASTQDITYPHVHLTLSSGVWLVSGCASIVANVSESVALALFDGNKIVLQGSCGMVSSAANPMNGSIVGFVTVRTQMTIWLRAQRNGGSTLSIGVAAANMNPAQRLSALKVA